jgi:hypothetical protein
MINAFRNYLYVTPNYSHNIFFIIYLFSLYQFPTIKDIQIISQSRAFPFKQYRRSFNVYFIFKKIYQGKVLRSIKKYRVFI